MKRILFVSCILFLGIQVLFCQVGIGTTTPHESSILEVSSTNKGFLLPRLTTIQRDDITDPASGLMIYNLDFNCLNVHQGSDFWFGLGGCDSSSIITFTGSPIYNGQSPINSQGIGYYNEPISSSSTIDITYNAKAEIPYTFIAEDMTTGLLYSATGITTVGNGNTVTLQPNNPTITTHGTINMTLTGSSNSLNLLPRIDIKSLSVNEIAVVEISVDLDNLDGDNNHNTGTDQIWMDRNLGAHQKATSYNNSLAYGSLFQWGRLDDGHEIIVTNGDDPTVSVGFSGTTASHATSDISGSNKFITISSTPYDWRITQNDNLWQGISGIKNPCPNGFRIPTELEINTLVSSLALSNITSAANSILAIPSSGSRRYSNGTISNVSSYSYLWNTTLLVTKSRIRYFSTGGTSLGSSFRANGYG